MSNPNERTAKEFHQYLIERHIYPSCLNCEFFDESASNCLKYNLKPPAKIIVFSCPEWQAEIPF